MKNKPDNILVSEIPSLNYDVIKSGYTEVPKDEQESFDRFKKDCEKTGTEVTYDNFQDWIHEPYYEDLQRRLAREENDIEYQIHLTEDGYRKITLSFDGKEPMEKWILRTTQPLKDNCVVFKCEGDEEIFGLIEDEDIPPMGFYLREDEEECYTDEEWKRMRKEKEDPNFLWNLHNFRRHCREQRMEDTCRYYTEWLENKEGA